MSENGGPCGPCGACGACAVCGLRSSLSCSRCLAVFYCGPQHQRDHWQLHRPDCSALYHIHTSQELGRHLVAARDIKQGSVILREKALVAIPFGPQSEPDFPGLKTISCPSCCGLLQPAMPSEWPQCRRCGVPLCSEDCKQVTAEASLHTDAECELLQRAGVRDKLSESLRVLILGTLRCLLLRGAKAKTLRSMVSHQHSQGTADMVGSLPKVMKRAFGKMFSPEDIKFVMGVVITNSFHFEVPEYDSNSGALFSNISLIAHSCRPNARMTAFGRNKADLTGAVIASLDIAAGSIITISYVDIMFTTTLRRRELQLSKHFHCRCERCEDLTEMATHYGSICCPRCTELGRPVSVLRVTGWDSWSQWPCPACGFQMTFAQVGRLIVQTVGEKSETEDPEETEECVRTLLYPRNVFHPTSSVIVQLKMKLVETYGHYHTCPYAEMPLEMLERKLELCREMLDVLDRLAPGLTADRGQVLQEELEALLELARRTISTASPGSAQAVVEKAQGVFSELRRTCMEPPKQHIIDQLASQLNSLKDSIN